MLKKVLSITAACLVILALISAAQAYTSDNVKDFMNYMSAGEVSDLQSRIEGIRSTRGLDVVIVITGDLEGKAPTAYADDYFDYNGYGIGSDRSGLLLLVSMGTRDVAISTSGKAISIFTDSRLDDILDDVSSYLSDNEYYKACVEFLEQVDYYATLGAPGGSDNAGSRSYLSRAASIAKSPIVYLIAAIIALIATLAVSSASKGMATITNRTYEESGSFELTASRDDFLRETTSRVRISSPSNSSGGSKGSSVHRSSSGRIHGGRSRKF